LVFLQKIFIKLFIFDNHFNDNNYIGRHLVQVDSSPVAVTSSQEASSLVMENIMLLETSLVTVDKELEHKIAAMETRVNKNLSGVSNMTAIQTTW
jgi:hypothetical protein